MPDIVDKPTRSRMMAGIRGQNTRPELSLRKALHACGFRYRLHDRALPGSPDLVFPKYRAVCFVHGCFWHRHPNCKYTTTPTTRGDFWKTKFATNIARDERNRNQLVDAGWRVAVVWECSLRGEGRLAIVSRLEGWLLGNSSEFSSDPQAENQGENDPVGATVPRQEALVEPVKHDLADQFNE